jgi:sugar-specific transcriptional regulator TrmB
MDEYIQLLEQYGLTEKESAIYVALLELGTADVSDIAKKAGVKRPTAYFVIDDLVKKGFISQSGGKVKQFVTEKPQKILALEKSKLAQLEKALPGLTGLASKSKHKPSARFFTGLDGVRAVYEESLLQAPGSEILSLGNAKAVLESMPGFEEWYIKRRVESRIHFRAVVTINPYNLSFAERDKAELRHLRFVDKELYTQDVEINIYGNKVSMVSFVENEFVGVIIDSKVFTAGHKQMFELLWSIGRELKEVKG